jgi:MoaA/NifB/PqqE/SkfB family radical SAM enzyme
MVEKKRSGQEEILANSDRNMLWWMNRQCNFNCVYCFRKWGDVHGLTEEPTSGKYSAEHIAERFDETGKVWHIYMTGGEPLLYPHFVKLAKELTRGHYISVSTNLSMSNAYELAETIDSKRVRQINANVHILEREKIKDGVKEYLRKFLYLQERGFNIHSLYITYPLLFGRIEEDIKRLRGEGVKRIKIKVFQGKYDSRRYPRDYSDEERAFIRGLGLDNYEQEILVCHVSFLGRKCQAGYLAFNMDMSGKVTRCSTLKDEYGNLFEGTFGPGKSSRRCTAKKCACPYQGMNFTSSIGSAVPPNIVVRPVRFSVAVGEWVGGLSSKVLR